MEPGHYKFGGGSTDSILHPIVLIGMIVVIILLVTLPRQRALAAFLFGVFLIPAGQQFVVGGVHIFVYRIIVLTGLVIMMQSGIKPRVAGRWNSIDMAFTLFVVCHVAAFTLQYREGAAVVNQVGFLWDYLGGYIFLRYAVRDRSDVLLVIRCLAIMTAIFAACMINEQFSDRNVFGELGGVPLISELRGGRVRSEAAFQHAILAGTFGAVEIPLFGVLWKSRQSRSLAAVGIVGSTIMVFTSACSTPILAYVASIIGISFWPIRKVMRPIRWALVGGLLCLNLVMSAPVWYVIAHVAVVGGSSANHRADLVDTFVRHIDEWWLLGTNANNGWGHDMFDTSNQYVQIGVTGGLGSLVSFVAIIVYSFKRVGKMRKIVSQAKQNSKNSEWFVWLLGTAIFANVVAYFGISYFDQTRVGWFALLAIICASTAELGARTNCSVRQVISDVTLVEPNEVGGCAVGVTGTRWYGEKEERL